MAAGPIPYLVKDEYVCFAINLEELDEDQRKALEQLVGSLTEAISVTPDHR